MSVKPVFKLFFIVKILSVRFLLTHPVIGYILYSVQLYHNYTKWLQYNVCNYTWYILHSIKLHQKLMNVHRHTFLLFSSTQARLIYYKERLNR